MPCGAPLTCNMCVHQVDMGLLMADDPALAAAVMGDADGVHADGGAHGVAHARLPARPSAATALLHACHGQPFASLRAKRMQLLALCMAAACAASPLVLQARWQRSCAPWRDNAWQSAATQRR